MKIISKTLGLLVALTAISQAAPPVTVTVGHPGNPADKTGFGAVAYEYKIGKYEVTNEEYCEWLNAVAKTDTYKLYDGRMGGQYGGIRRTGEQGAFIYTLKDGWAKKPVNYVTFETCVRYVNWLSNGGGSGDTEKGSYSMKWGEVTPPNHAELAKADTVKWVLATENEWYKAAYFDATKPGGAGYWPYPFKGGSVPGRNLNSNVPKDVGNYKDFPSPSGTYDQAGNVWEYNETRSGGKVGLRGGSFFINDHNGYLRSSYRSMVLSSKWQNYGFRVVALGGGKPPTEEK